MRKPMSEEMLASIERSFGQANDPPFKHRSNSTVILELCAEVRRSWAEVERLKWRDELHDQLCRQIAEYTGREGTLSYLQDWAHKQQSTITALVGALDECLAIAADVDRGMPHIRDACNAALKLANGE